MMCTNPFVKAKGQVYGCGQCLPCRINRRRVWAHRITLEAAQHADNCFATLSYADEFLPEGGSVNAGEFSGWIKRLRTRCGGLRFRYFGVGEYGETTGRPHYHAALFGFPTCRFGSSRYGEGRKRCCVQCDLVADTWKVGNIFLGTLEPASARYLAGYVTKKVSSNESGQRAPVFTRMSLKPGIGYDALHEVASQVLRYELVQREGDVPGLLRHGSAKLPLGRYLRRNLRLMCGEDADATEVTKAQAAAAVSDVFEAAEAVTSAPGMRRFLRSVAGDLLEARDKGKVERALARYRIFNRKERL